MNAHLIATNFKAVDGECRSVSYDETSSVGSIRVRVYHMRSHRPEKDGHYYCAVDSGENIISETDMKGRVISHCLEYVSLCAPPHRTINPNTIHSVENGKNIEDPEPEYENNFLDEEELPFAVFDFYYRSRGSWSFSILSFGITPLMSPLHAH